MVKQKMIVAATMWLHNFIRDNHDLDKDFNIDVIEISIMFLPYKEV
jgi:hypothetical protein